MKRSLLLVAAALVGLGSACTRRGKEIQAGVELIRLAADPPRPPRLFDDAGVDCAPFRGQPGDCPLVPRCEVVRQASEGLVHNACETERASLARVVPCSSGPRRYCTATGFPSCETLTGRRCEFDLAVCEVGLKLASVACCRDASQCEIGTYAAPPRSP